MSHHLELKRVWTTRLVRYAMQWTTTISFDNMDSHTRFCPWNVETPSIPYVINHPRIFFTHIDLHMHKQCSQLQ